MKSPRIIIFLFLVFWVFIFFLQLNLVLELLSEAFACVYVHLNMHF